MQYWYSPTILNDQHLYVGYLWYIICIYFYSNVGAGLYFGTISALLFLLFHVSHLFVSLAFPFKAQCISRSFSLKLKIHIAEVTFAVLCGLLPGIIIANTSKYTYFAFPIACTPSSSLVTFYTLLLPISIGSAIGLCLLFASFWIVHKVSNVCHWFMYTLYDRGPYRDMYALETRAYLKCFWGDWPQGASWNMCWNLKLLQNTWIQPHLFITFGSLNITVTVTPDLLELQIFHTLKVFRMVMFRW